jgi:ubiquinone/menaquinone biosynthesis C-methylase UbiE
MYHAAIESSRIFSHAVREVAQSSGLLTLLADFRTVDEIMTGMDFLPEKRPQLGCLLELLASQEILAQTTRDGEPAYRRREDIGVELHNGSYVPRQEYIADWYGEDYAEAIRVTNIEFLGHDLEFLRKPQEFARFDKGLEEEWRITMTGPLYEYGRKLCVEELVARGNRFLDLACGPGYGCQRLAEAASAPCSIVAFDKSADFIDMTRALPYPRGTELQAEVHDLNEALPELDAESFDGIMFNGSFHFIQDKPARLAEVWRMLRPGGLLSLGHTFARSGFPDQAMREFYFSMLADDVFPLDWDDLVGLTRQAGFRPVREFHQGSYSYLLVERPRAAHEGSDS